MAEPRLVLPIASEETARLKWFEAFMRGRVELEQQTISGLQALLEGSSPLPEHKLLWHCALEKLLDGTRKELRARIAELESLKDQMQIVGMSIARAEMCDLNIEFEKLESTESIDSAQAATVTSYNDWLDIESVDVSVSVQKGLSYAFSSDRARKEKLKEEEALKSRKSKNAFGVYYEQDLAYRRTIHQQWKSREEFLNSIPDRIQEHGTKYRTAVCDVGKVMESFSNYLRDVSSTCNSSGSELWTSAKNMKPLVDANVHAEAIEFAYHQSPYRFSPIYYQNPESKSSSPSGQTILFGYPLELCTVGELKTIPPVLTCLLDSVRTWPQYNPFTYTAEWWALVNEIEQAWTGVEESDRAIISMRVQANPQSPILGYFWALPKPVLSEVDWSIALSTPVRPLRETWNTWSKDPIKAAVLRALFSCHVRLGPGPFSYYDIAPALAQSWAPTGLSSLLFSLSQIPDIWRSVASNGQDAQEETSQ